MYFKIISFSTIEKITKINILCSNGSKFNLEYPINMLLDIDIIKIINSKSMMTLHSNIISLINNYDMTNEEHFLVKEFLKWIMFNLNIVHIEIS